MARGGARPRLAGALSGGGRTARIPGRGRGPGRDRPARRARLGAAAEPPPAHGMVRAPGAPPPRCAAGPGVTPRVRAVRAGLVLAVLLVVSFGVVAPPERCPSVTAAELKRSAQSTVDWF